MDLYIRRSSCRVTHNGRKLKGTLRKLTDIIGKNQLPFMCDNGELLLQYCVYIRENIN